MPGNHLKLLTGFLIASIFASLENNEKLHHHLFVDSISFSEIRDIWWWQVSCK